MQRINLHTHRLNVDGHIQLLNVYAQDLPVMNPDQIYTCGLHPWHLEKVNADSCIQAIETEIKQQNMLAIGECGIDRAIKTPYSVQELYFKKQLDLAVKCSKPILIHCVRAYSDLLKLKKESKSNIPWILHGYNGNQEITANLIRHGFYFSIGLSFLKDEQKQKYISSIPANRLFLETDDQDCTIEQIYMLASQVLGSEIELITETIYNNFRSVFNEFRL
jgi:TatD DNase family protein